MKKQLKSCALILCVVSISLAFAYSQQPKHVTVVTDVVGVDSSYHIVGCYDMDDNVQKFEIVIPDNNKNIEEYAKSFCASL